MEVLNKNQRETALWRLVSFGVVILALIGLVLFSSYKAFAIKGSGDEDKLRRQLEECQHDAIAVKHRLQNEKHDLEDQIKSMKAELKILEPSKQNLKSECELWKSKYEASEKELARCEAKVRAADSN